MLRPWPLQSDPRKLSLIKPLEVHARTKDRDVDIRYVICIESMAIP